MILDSKLTFEEHYKIVLRKTIKIIGLLHKLQTLNFKTAKSCINN